MDYAWLWRRDGAKKAAQTCQKDANGCGPQSTVLKGKGRWVLGAHLTSPSKEQTREPYNLRLLNKGVVDLLESVPAWPIPFQSCDVQLTPPLLPSRARPARCHEFPEWSQACSRYALTGNRLVFPTLLLPGPHAPTTMAAYIPPLGPCLLPPREPIPSRSWPATSVGCQLAWLNWQPPKKGILWPATNPAFCANLIPLSHHGWGNIPTDIYITQY
jgi:hypothetical protein